MGLQVVAFLLYPPSYLIGASQAIVMPLALLVLFLLAIVGLNTRTLTPEGTRNLLIFVQGVNMVVRIMTVFPNLSGPAGNWAWGLLATQLVGLALSWFAMLELEHHSLRELDFRNPRTTA